MDVDYITVVSGLPRSGTSMLMKMLVAGGFEPVIDGIREADDDNPGGYYEFEKVKKMGEDTAWLDEAKGKVVKVISQLLTDLPDHHHYKIIFIHREMSEILASQQVMLQRRGQAADAVSDDEIGQLFRQHLGQVQRWMETQNHLSLLSMHYADILADPVTQSKQIAEFLAAPVDERAMAGIVDENLYRQRK
jgi:hypothetical protein